MKQQYGLLTIGMITGIAYGLLTHLVLGQYATLASVTYLLFIPAILGMIPMIFADNEQLKSNLSIVLIPCLTIVTYFLTLLLLGLADVIGLLILTIPFFFLATIGALIYRKLRFRRLMTKGKLLTVIMLPFLFAPIEAYMKTPTATNTIKSEVIISATPETIWNNIVAVKTIDKSEYNAGFFNSVGIPRPINATVDKQGVGGQRIGNFEGGLKFIETITEYKENELVSFDIAIDPNSVRQKVFDQQVLNGGFFKFVDATYQLTELADGQVKLSLSSSYQLKSTINFYGRFWGNIILTDFQDRLLSVIEARCEKSKSY